MGGGHVCGEEGVYGRGMHGRVGDTWLGARVTGGVHGRGHAWWGGACVAGVCAWQGGVHVWWGEGSTHPTGMHFCFMMYMELSEHNFDPISNLNKQKSKLTQIHKLTPKHHAINTINCCAMKGSASP